ncbi:HU family DNA-binding protein [Pseudomonas putida]|uniref:HU family DNA-binding protein n=1 Tax=Pseudomonas putida TaxID=303 RepID=UPI00322088C9
MAGNAQAHSVTPRNKDMNKTELIAQVADKTDLTKAQAGKVVHAMIEAFNKSLKKEGEIKLIGFGTFKRDIRAGRKGRDPRTGQEIDIKAAPVVKFKAGKKLKDAVAEQDPNRQ